VEPSHHDGGERLRRKRAADVLGSPGATVHQVSGRHYRLDELELEPLLDVIDDLARDCWITAGVELLCEEPKEIAITKVDTRPPAAVFAFLTDPEKILRWMGTEAPSPSSLSTN
jgi:hypothetical protein